MSGVPHKLRCLQIAVVILNATRASAGERGRGASHTPAAAAEHSNNAASPPTSTRSLWGLYGPLYCIFHRYSIGPSRRYIAFCAKIKHGSRSLQDTSSRRINPEAKNTKPRIPEAASQNNLVSAAATAADRHSSRITRPAR